MLLIVTKPYSATLYLVKLVWIVVYGARVKFYSNPFGEIEIREAFFHMKNKSKAAVADGVPLELCKSCWDIIKIDMIELFAIFHARKLDFIRCNYGIITSNPEKKGEKESNCFDHVFT
jgi:hypothetical protein